MAYFKINDVDFSNIVKEMNITYTPIYTSQTNAAGNTVIDLINRKRVIEVEFIPTEQSQITPLLELVKSFNVNVSYRDAETNKLETNVNCFINEYTPEYYRIGNKVIYNSFDIEFEEL